MTDQTASQRDGWELDENPNCARTRVTIQIKGETFDPATATTALGIQPTFSASKGERRPLGTSPDGPPVTQPTGIWLFSTRNLSSTSLELHLRAVLDMLEPVADSLSDLLVRQDTSIQLLCYWVSATGQGGPGITAESLKRIAALNAAIVFEFQGPFGE
jgi:hypothetical protein